MAGPFFGGPFFGGGFFGSAAAAVGHSPAKKRPTLRLREIKDRKEIGEFLKDQLALRHPDSAFHEPVVDRAAEEKARKALAKQERREKEMRRKADDAAAKFAKDTAAMEARNLEVMQTQNDNMRILLMLASAV